MHLVPLTLAFALTFFLSAVRGGPSAGSGDPSAGSGDPSAGSGDGDLVDGVIDTPAGQPNASEKFVELFEQSLVDTAEFPVSRRIRDCCPRHQFYDCGSIYTTRRLPCRWIYEQGRRYVCCPVSPTSVRTVTSCNCRNCIVPVPETSAVPWYKERCFKKGYCTITRASTRVLYRCFQMWFPTPSVAGSDQTPLSFQGIDDVADRAIAPVPPQSFWFYRYLYIYMGKKCTCQGRLSVGCNAVPTDDIIKEVERKLDDDEELDIQLNDPDASPPCC